VYKRQPLGCATSSPTDSTTYYLFNSGNAIGTSATACPQKALKNGTITGVAIMISGIAGTNEAVACAAYNATKATAYSLTNRDWSSLPDDFIEYCSLAVSAGDIVGVRFITPAWVNNPTSLNMKGYLLIECE
jgi:hypothetical protein